MINKEIITQILEEAIQTHNSHNVKEVKVEVEGKCTVSNRPQFKEAIRNIAYTKGLQITFGGRGEEISVSLYDKQNNTRIDFTKKFLDMNLIDYNNNDTEGKTNLEDVISAYTSLPDKMKKKVNLLEFNEEPLENDGGLVYGQSSWIDPYHNEFSTVEINPNVFTDKDSPSLAFIMGHEVGHCYDYQPIPSKDKEVLTNLMNGNVSSPSDFEVMKKYAKMNESEDKFLHSPYSYGDAQEQNKNWLYDKYGDLPKVPLVDGGSIDPYDLLNMSSNYGYLTGDNGEDYAEACGIIISGHSNPQSTVEWANVDLSYNDWVATHPYQAQYLLKDLYGENHTIEELIGWGDTNHLRLIGVDKTSQIMDDTVYGDFI